MVPLMEIVAGVMLLVIVAFVIGKRLGTAKASIVNVSIQPDSIQHKQSTENDTDSWEGGFWDASDPKELFAHLEFEYRDGNGSISTRKVKVRQFDTELYGGILLGHCELRGATRTFRFDRISNCVDLETGQSIDNIKHYLTELYEKSPGKSAEVLATDYIDVLKVLYYVAKADGQFRKEEKEVISTYVSELLRDDRITVSLLEGVFRELDAPSLQSFKLALGRIFKSEQVSPDQLRNCCNAIVDTQKSVHPSEKEALDYIDKKIKEIAGICGAVESDTLELKG